MTTLAIEFGTARLKAAYWDTTQQKAVVLKLGQGGRQYAPSLFHIDTQGNISFGEEAESRIFLDPPGALENLKIHLHNPIQRIPNRQDQETSILLTFMFNSVFQSVVKHETYFQGNMPEQLVITYPALWDYQWPDYEDVYTRALKNAHYTGEIEFLSEPLAVANTWINGANVKPGDVAIIIDCGAGTIDWAAVIVDAQLQSSLVDGCRPESTSAAGWQVETGLFELMLEKLDFGQQSYALKHKYLVMDHLRRLKETEFCNNVSSDNLERLSILLNKDTFVFEIQDFRRILGERVLKPVESGSQAYLRNLFNKMNISRITCLLVGGVHTLVEKDENISKSLLAVAQEYSVKCEFLKLNEAEFATVLGKTMKNNKSSKNLINHHIAVEKKMNTSEITHVIGFDFGDSETALSQVSANNAHDRPTEISCNLANNNTHIIKTVVGYKSNGDILVGQAAAASREIKHNGLHVGFKVMPESGDQLYKHLAVDFINTVFDHLAATGKIDIKSSKVIIGHPSRWKHINEGEPVSILEGIIATTRMGKNTLFEVVPESRGAMIEGIEGNLFQAAHYQSGSVLVVDIGSSTSDFTAINVSQKESAPMDYGEEIGARLIDRAIASLALEKSRSKDLVNEMFMSHPEERARFELFCREKKEEYYAGEAVEAGYPLFINNERIYIDISLDHETMHSITTEFPVVKINGEVFSWREGFKKTLQQVKINLEAQGIDNVKAILLTGGASQMNFVLDVCGEVFPELSTATKRSLKPSFDIANGLARWGRKQLKTDKFIKDIDVFCKEKITVIVERQVDDLYVTLSNSIADNLIAIIKREFDKWQSGSHSTISVMNIQIESEIKKWIDNQLPREIGKISTPWLGKIADKLTIEIASVENLYDIKTGSLGKSFSLSSLGSHNINTNVNIRDIDVTDGTANVFANIIGTVAGLISAVVAAYVIPIVLVVIVKIISIISITLAGWIAGLLLTNPAGWAFLVGLVGVAILYGGNAKEVVSEKIKDYDLPNWIRNLVSANSVYEKIREKRSDIVNEILIQMRKQKKLSSDIALEVTNQFSESLKEVAEDARMLIK